MDILLVYSSVAVEMHFKIVFVPTGTIAVNMFIIFCFSRHSSSEQCSALNTQLTPLVAPSNGSESKPAWGLMVPLPGVKDKSGLTVEGHRPLFMQRSDPLAQRSFSCWQTGGV